MILNLKIFNPIKSSVYLFTEIFISPLKMPIISVSILAKFDS